MIVHTYVRKSNEQKGRFKASKSIVRQAEDAEKFLHDQLQHVRGSVEQGERAQPAEQETLRRLTDLGQHGEL